MPCQGLFRVQITHESNQANLNQILPNLSVDFQSVHGERPVVPGESTAKLPSIPEHLANTSFKKGYAMGAVLQQPKSIDLLAIHKNWNRSILGVVPSIYRNTVGNLTLQKWIRYQSQYRISGCIERTNLKITKIHPTYNDYSCPLIDTGGITPLF